MYLEMQLTLGDNLWSWGGGGGNYQYLGLIGNIPSGLLSKVIVALSYFTFQLPFESQDRADKQNRKVM